MSLVHIIVKGPVHAEHIMVRTTRGVGLACRGNNCVHGIHQNFVYDLVVGLGVKSPPGRSVGAATVEGLEYV